MCPRTVPSQRASLPPSSANEAPFSLPPFSLLSISRPLPSSPPRRITPVSSPKPFFPAIGGTLCAIAAGGSETWLYNLHSRWTLDGRSPCAPPPTTNPTPRARQAVVLAICARGHGHGHWVLGRGLPICIAWAGACICRWANVFVCFQVRQIATGLAGVLERYEGYGHASECDGSLSARCTSSSTGREVTVEVELRRFGQCLRSRVGREYGNRYACMSRVGIPMDEVVPRSWHRQPNQRETSVGGWFGGTVKEKTKARAVAGALLSKQWWSRCNLFCCGRFSPSRTPLRGRRSSP